MAETDDYRALHALATNAQLFGGTVDLSGLGPNFREFAVKYLRELANRIESPDGVYFDPYRCTCGESDPADHLGTCAAWVGDHR